MASVFVQLQIFWQFYLIHFIRLFMMLYVVLLSTLMILFSTVGDRASICGNSYNLLLNLNLNLVYETLWTGNESDLLTNFSPTSHFILSENVRNPYISDVFREHRNGTLGSNVLISVLGKLNLFRLIAQITLVLLMWNQTSLSLMRNYLSLLNRIVANLTVAHTLPL